MVKLPKTTKVSSDDLTLANPLGSLPPVPPAPVQNELTGRGIGTKEREFFAEQDAVALEEIRKDLEVSPEVKEAGIELKHEEIELPPSLQKVGVTTTDTTQTLATPVVTMPISDDKIVTGLGAPVVTSLRWLVEWCVRQLKKVHVKLKKVHGQIVRIVTK